jgi:YHS domain-containing protein
MIRTLTFIALLALAASLATGAETQKARCIVSGKEIEVTAKTPKVFVQGKPHYFCCENCPKGFAKNPEKWVKDPGKCPVLQEAIPQAEANLRLIVNNGLWYTCCPGCKDGLPNTPDKLKKLEDVVSGKSFTVTDSSPRLEHQSQLYIFESAETKAAFEKEPAKYVLLYAR